MKSELRGETRSTEAGFTLVEALSAIVILAFGLMAITNLLLVAASSNTVANQSSAATASASQMMDSLQATSWNNLVPGGDINNDVGAPAVCNGAIPAGVYNCNADISGVGMVHTRWQISVPGDIRMLFIQVRSEGTGALARARSRAEFTNFRSCTGPAPCPQLP